MWKKFLSNPDFQIHREVKFPHLLSESNQGPQIFADATGNAMLGFGCIFPEKGIWAYACWPLGFFKQQTPSISLLELYAIVIAVEMWAHLLQGKQICLCSDNEATVFCINKKSSKNQECMFLIRHLTLTCMKFQIYVTAQHYQGKRNVLVDVLSRGKIQHFHKLSHTLSMNPNPTLLPATLWPISWQLLQTVDKSDVTPKGSNSGTSQNHPTAIQQPQSHTTIQPCSKTNRIAGRCTHLQNPEVYKHLPCTAAETKRHYCSSTE